MANTFPAGLIPVVYRAANDVAKELKGMINAVDQRFMPAPEGAIARIPIAPAQTSTTYAPGAYAPTGTSRTATYTDVEISSNEVSEFYLTGAEQEALDNGGNQNAEILFQGSVAECMRVLSNKVEATLTTLYPNACRAIGAGGTTPFASDVKDVMKIRKILVDQGAGDTDLQLVMDTEAGLNLRSVANLLKVDEAGTDDLLRRGQIMQLGGIGLHESAQIKTHTAGTSNGAYLVNLIAGYPAGSTAIALDTGAGTIIAGDVMFNSFAGRDANKYVVRTALGAGTVTLRSPGIIKAWVDNDTVNTSASYVANMAFKRSAIVLVTAPPAIMDTPIIQTTLATDSVSGLTFLIAKCLQDGQITYRVHLTWGAKVVRPDYCALLLG